VRSQVLLLELRFHLLTAGPDWVETERFEVWSTTMGGDAGRSAGQKSEERPREVDPY